MQHTTPRSAHTVSTGLSGNHTSRSNQLTQTIYTAENEMLRDEGIILNLISVLPIFQFGRNGRYFA
ncbi:hypothetical protein C6497_07450 [Candidatus Poribacteria bacterium]|nr:MAG: hypothetical protein C6497_07450 [Candidatus Poribacteria bacterium]